MRPQEFINRPFPHPAGDTDTSCPAFVIFLFFKRHSLEFPLAYSTDFRGGQRRDSSPRPPAAEQESRMAAAAEEPRVPGPTRHTGGMHGDSHRTLLWVWDARCREEGPGAGRAGRTSGRGTTSPPEGVTCDDGGAGHVACCTPHHGAPPQKHWRPPGRPSAGGPGERGRQAGLLVMAVRSRCLICAPPVCPRSAGLRELPLETTPFPSSFLRKIIAAIGTRSTS